MTSKSKKKSIWVIGMGSRGEAQPLSALCYGLMKTEKYSVTLLCNIDHKELADDLGIPFIDIMWNFHDFISGKTDSGSAYKDALGRNDTFNVIKEQRAHNERYFGPYVEKFDKLLQKNEAENTRPDLILYSLGMYALAAYANIRYSIPLLPTNFQVPVLKDKKGPPPGLGLPILPCGCNTIWSYVLTYVAYSILFKYDGKLCGKYLGLDPIRFMGYKNLRKELIAHPSVKHPYLIGASPLIASSLYSHLEMPEQIHMTGPWVIPETVQIAGKSEEDSFGGKETFNKLLQFFSFDDEQKKPVYIGWGSMISESSTFMTQLAVRALKHANQKGIVLGGCASLSPDLLLSDNETNDDYNYAQQNILFVDKAPHEWLFPKCSCIVHHGGAGTTHASLRSGVPTIVTPVIGDQPFHGEWVSSLGAGLHTAILPKVTVEELGNAIIKCTTMDNKNQENSFQVRAREVSHQIRKENGVENAEKVISDLFDKIEKDPKTWGSTGLFIGRKNREKVSFH